MTTIATPRMTRTFDYALGEVNAIHGPEGTIALTKDYQLMMAQDISERDIIMALFSAVCQLAALDELERVIERIIAQKS